jgi:type I restriction enzyme R subunit
VADPAEEYLAREAKARINIDRQLGAAGWVVQHADKANLSAGRGVVVREFILEKGHGRVDYLLFIDGQPVGVIEAKPEGTTLTEVEHQSGKYVDGLPAWMKPPVYPLPFIYESTGAETHFTNGYDPDARSRRVFTFHRPETLAEWTRQITADPGTPTFRARLRTMPVLDNPRLWDVQATAIRNLEESLQADRPRALIQMATGSGKTFTAANVCYRLIRHADAKRILFLVDRSNLGRQTKLEFETFDIDETKRKFTAEYNIQHLTSNTIDTTARVCIATVQRIYSILKGEPEMDPELDEHSIYELSATEPAPVEYNPVLPPEAFDVVIIDECHRSIYGLWRQVLEYFDAHLIGLTATPAKQTFGLSARHLFGGRRRDEHFNESGIPRLVFERASLYLPYGQEEPVAPIAKQTVPVILDSGNELRGLSGAAPRAQEGGADSETVLLERAALSVGLHNLIAKGVAGVRHDAPHE